jgi:dTDP-4-dehydrorhamnose reductase
MRIALIGASGQLGTDLREQLRGEVIPLSQPEFDVRCEDLARAALERAAPNVVVNCAAVTNVDGCEDDPVTAFSVNAAGALHVARSANSIGAAVVYISTDYVFGGQVGRVEPYHEEDAPAPLNVYGASKLAGEQLTRAYNRRALVVRTCGLYGRVGARGKGGNFVETMLRLAAQSKPIRVVDDQRLSPTSTTACAGVIAELVARDATGLVHVAAADSCTWYEFARAILAEQGVAAEIRPIRSSEYAARARRPQFSALCSRRLAQAGAAGCPPWREMLREYLRTRTPVHA